MGRTQKSQGLAPPAIRKELRAKQARHIVNKLIPALLASNARARNGSENSELIADPTSSNAQQKDLAKDKVHGGGDEARYIKRKGQGRRKVKGSSTDDVDELAVMADYENNGRAKGKRMAESVDETLSQLSIKSPPKRTVRIVTTDTLTATHVAFSRTKSSKKAPNPCILNMASPLRPGGGVLTGATSQEEFLCARTTLLPSLKETYYRLPEYGGIYTRDVLVFRNALPLSDSAGELNPTERYYIDVISAGMLRFPELEGAEDETKYLSKKDNAIVEQKMRAVLRLASSHGVQKLVLGAWGCGAYGNPVRDIAQAWSRVINGESVGRKKSKVMEPPETWNSITEIIFAISNAKMASEFAHAFSPKIAVETGPDGHVEEDDEETDSVAEELRVKIKEMEGQVGSVWNHELKMRMGAILDDLRAQLQERVGGSVEEHDEEESDSDQDENDDDEEHSNMEVCNDDVESDEDSEDSEDGGLGLSPAR